MRRGAAIGILIGITYLCGTDHRLLWSVSPQWETGYQERLKKLVEARTWTIGPGTSDEDAGKEDWPALLAELWKARGDAARQQELIRNEGAVLLASRWAGSFYKPFTAPGYTLYYSQYKDVLPADQVERIRRMVRHDGWNYLTRVDHRMDPLYRRTEFNSENFNWMARMAGVFWSHESTIGRIGNTSIRTSTTWSARCTPRVRWSGTRACTGGTRSRRRWCCTNRRTTPK